MLLSAGVFRSDNLNVSKECAVLNDIRSARYLSICIVSGFISEEHRLLRRVRFGKNPTTIEYLWSGSIQTHYVVPAAHDW